VVGEEQVIFGRGEPGLEEVCRDRKLIYSETWFLTPVANSWASSRSSPTASQPGLPDEPLRRAAGLT
jgi:hypothetical protein